MLNACEIRMWGTIIGQLAFLENRPYASFEYDRDFLNSGIELSPIMMPLSDRVYAFPALVNDAFHGVPGLIADSLPDRFGNAVINTWLMSQQKSMGDFNAIDRLCYTGSRGMGALEYRPATGPVVSVSEPVNISEMVKFASDILSERRSVDMNWDENLTYTQLVRLGTSAGGARAKAVIAWNKETGDVRSGQIDAGDGYDYYIIKFDGVTNNGDHDLTDRTQYTVIEYAYHQMAVDAGITMSDCYLYEENGRRHFMTRRFDRVNGGKLHMQTLGALAHIDYNIPGLCSYEQASQYMKRLGLGQTAVEQLYRRMVFNVLGVNQDDHVKNISFLMDKRGEWFLAPAYDITFAYDRTNRWLSAHQMLINNKRDHITMDDLVESGKQMGLSSRKCRTVISDVEAAIVKWQQTAERLDIDPDTIRMIHELMMQNR